MTHASILKKHSKLVYTLAASQLDSREDVEAAYEAVFVRYAQTLPFLFTKSRAVEWFTKTTVIIVNRIRRENAARGSATGPTAPAARPSKALQKRTLAAMPSRLRIRRAQSAAFIRAHRRAIGYAAVTTAAVVLACCVTADVSALGPSSYGCTAAIVEARVCNDVLYLAIDQDFGGLVETISGTDLLDRYDIIAPEYIGGLTDQHGHAFHFTDEQMVFIGTFDNHFENADQIDAFRSVSHYKVYLPGLAEACNDSTYEWQCSVDVIPNLARQDSGQSTALTPLRAQAPLTLPAVPTQIYRFDYTYTVADIEFAFRRLYVSEEEVQLIIELIPHGSLEGTDPKEWYPNVCVLGAESESMQHTIWGELAEQTHVLTYRSHHYFSVTNACAGLSGYWIDTAENGSFEVTELGYVADGDSVDYVREFVSVYRTDGQEEPDGDNDTEESDSLSIDGYREQTMPPQSVAVGKIYDTETNRDGNSYSFYELSQSFTAGGLTFRTVGLRSDQTVLLDDVRINGEALSPDSDKYWWEEFIELRYIAFWAEKDGVIIGQYNDMTTMRNRDGGTIYELRGEVEEIPDRIIFSDAIYSVYDDETTHQDTVYAYYDPAYYTEEQSEAEREEDKRTERESALFAAHNTFTAIP